MSTGSRLPDDLRQSAIDDYLSGGDSYAVVAARHGISRSVLHGWINPSNTPRDRSNEWTEAEVALTGGSWVNVAGIKRWQPFIAPSKRNLSDRARRVEWEDAMFDEDEARDLHARHFNGCREPRTVMGERVYQRRKKRNQTARKKAA